MYYFDSHLSSIDSSATAAPGPDQEVQVEPGPLALELLDKLHRYWSAANYLCVGQIYLKDNALLREPLRAEHIKPRLLGHWGTSVGQNFIRSRPWRSYPQCLRLARRYLQRCSSADRPG